MAFFCSGCSPSLKDNCPVDNEASAKTIYLVSHGWHVGIVVKRIDIPDDVWPNLKNFANADYLEIGWGDKGHLEDFCRTSHQMSDKLSKQAS
jgi:hypothetical protein